LGRGIPRGLTSSIGASAGASVGELTLAVREMGTDCKSSVTNQPFSRNPVPGLQYKDQRVRKR